MIITKITDQKWLNLYKASWVDKEGKDREWIFVSRHDPSLVNNTQDAEAVVIIPILKNIGEQNRLVVTKEWRAPVNDYEHGFPAGLIDTGEKVSEAIKRELFEETGLVLTKIHKISPPVFTSAGVSPGRVCYAFVYCDGEITNKNTEDGEEIEAISYSFEELQQYLQSDACFGSRTWLIIENMLQHGSVEFD